MPASKKAKTNTNDLLKETKMLVIDARESAEVQVVLVGVESAPFELREQLARNLMLGLVKYNNVHFTDGAAGTQGLVREEDEEEDGEEDEDGDFDPEDACTACSTWFDSINKPENDMPVPYEGKIDFRVSIVEV
jgi:hypothetical protein